jgi:hypothetical protein
MSEIPEGIMTAAESCYYGSEALDGAQVIDKIANAILAERQRCLAVVRSVEVYQPFPKTTDLKKHADHVAMLTLSKVVRGIKGGAA